MGKIKRSYPTTANAYLACDERNSAAAYRQFRGSVFLSGVNETVAATMRHKALSGVLALMGIAGLIGWFWTFGGSL